jgi:hypothetical protein
MALRDVANIIEALRPFSVVETETLATHGNHVGFRADFNFFKANPKIHYAVRRSLCEFDSIADLSDFPPPPQYVCVYKDSDEQHTLHGIFRGVPAWRQVYCHGFEYADLKTDGEALDLMLDCIRNGGMDEASLAQFEMHNQRAVLMRAFSATSARNDGKVN